MAVETTFITVVVVCAPAPHEVREWVLELPSGATVEQALQASGLAALEPGWDPARMEVGVWGRRAGGEQALRDRDRVEIYRPLRVDPKVARRERFAKQGVGRSGLFAQRRPGAKAGY